MGICCKEKEKTEECIPIPAETAIKLSKSICKILYKDNNEPLYGTGFFMIYQSLKCLISNYHVISQDLINKNIEIEIFNVLKFNIKLDLNTRYIRFFEKPIDISIIEIKDSDGINEYIEYLNYDLNNGKGYSQYENNNLICIGYPLGKELSQGTGKITFIDGFQFYHNIPSLHGSSGSPILLFDTLKVVGIHKGGIIKKKINVGTFFGAISNEIDMDLKKINKLENNNYIIAKINIDQNSICEDIRIIYSYDKYKRESKKQNCNEEEIKLCEIEKNGYLIPFNYYHKFEKEGQYIIKYTFNKYLTKTNYMFFGCSKITNIDLSNFNTKNITDMSHMFDGCESLTNIDLSIFNTQKVINMSYMFGKCNSLTNINLSNFNTENIINMNGMFSGCKSLKNLNLDNFKTQNVTNMSKIFFDCSSLKNLNLDYFNTQKVIDMSDMFGKCNSLTNINLSNFSTQNVTKMSCMFARCESLPNINLTNFNTQNVTDMQGMFAFCSSFRDINLSNFNTQKVINMDHMFEGCKYLTNLNLSNFNTKNVTNMSGMFFNCSCLKVINLYNFNTQNVTDMSIMFGKCNSLTDLDLSNFNTQNVTNMSGMFGMCSSLTNINLSSFNTNNVTDMSAMFSYCSSLRNINLSNFNTKNVVNMLIMFFGCTSLKKENILTRDLKILEEYKYDRNYKGI